MKVLVSPNVGMMKGSPEEVSHSRDTRSNWPPGFFPPYHMALLEFRRNEKQQLGVRKMD